MKKINKRVLISFDDLCPYQCKHCYTLDIKRKSDNRTISEIVDSIASKEFDVVYVSQRRDNFVIPDEGLELCEEIFKRYKCNIFIITRNIFNKPCIERLLKLKNKMQENDKEIIVAVSVLATHSYTKSENPHIVPSPYERLEFLKELSNNGIKTVVIIRPVFPRHIIPIDELYEIVDICKTFDTCVVSSGLAVNDNIIWRLGLTSEDMCYLENTNYLEGAMEGELRFLNVEKELDDLKLYCDKQKVPFFEHTMQSINYVLCNP